MVSGGCSGHSEVGPPLADYSCLVAQRLPILWTAIPILSTVRRMGLEQKEPRRGAVSVTLCQTHSDRKTVTRARVMLSSVKKDDLPQVSNYPTLSLAMPPSSSRTRLDAGPSKAPTPTPSKAMFFASESTPSLVNVFISTL